ncbi:hypothetical protein AMAG_03968 [Allomyces macrogynus ATCC 38327]|uniref:Cysteine dioxygenase n=1 Tax=Allomyces macrogynus (strain ATCC 38327) TaxID=578462 RepID=A0A0L0S7Q0_ALLM3|nr:hypothetical protein AMAG_03968 [Allomyces macrogynus ATCC 38327]|eukprot:KNE58389.1 hypothetical protein AMAG_03968 [Allomyces macrogynus ATCC 38327]
MLKEELGPHGLDADDVDVSRVLGLMEAYQSNATDWAQYALFDPYRYTRNLVDDGNGRFNLMILCWSPGHISPIHDHANAHCCMKMLEGELVETRFDTPGNSASMPLHTADDHEAHGSRLHMSGKRVLEHNKVAYISDKIGLHRVSNASDRPAVSLHLYTPPFQTCNTFCERTGIARPVSQCVFYSRMGYRCPTLSGTVTEPKEGIAGGNSASIENNMAATAPAQPFAKDGMPIAFCTAPMVASRQG